MITDAPAADDDDEDADNNDIVVEKEFHSKSSAKNNLRCSASKSSCKIYFQHCIVGAIWRVDLKDTE